MLRVSGKLKLGSLIAAAAILLAGCSEDTGTNNSAGEFPSRELNIIAGGGPGGGLDTVSRQLVTGLEDSGIDNKFNVINNAAGNGNAARADMLSKPNDGYTVVADSNRVILNPMMGTTDLQLEDFTPIAQLSIGDVAWVVPADSEYQSAEDVIAAVKDDPTSITFGVGSTPSNEQLNILLPLEAAGVEGLTNLNIVNFLDGGAVNTELLGGRIDLASTGAAEADELVKSGDFRVLSTSGDDRHFDDVPTWIELGYDVKLQHWRGIFGPADMPEEAKKWWIDSIRAATETEAWKQSVENVGLETAFLPGDEFKEEILDQKSDMEEIYREIGLIS